MVRLGIRKTTIAISKSNQSLQPHRRCQNTSLLKHTTTPFKFLISFFKCSKHSNYKNSPKDDSLLLLYESLRIETNLYPISSIVFAKIQICIKIHQLLILYLSLNLPSTLYALYALCTLEDTKIPWCNVSFSKSSFVQNQDHRWLYRFPFNGLAFPQFGEISLNVQVFRLFR